MGVGRACLLACFYAMCFPGAVFRYSRSIPLFGCFVPAVSPRQCSRCLMALGNPFWSFIFGHLFAGLSLFFSPWPWAIPSVGVSLAFAGC